MQGNTIRFKPRTFRSQALKRFIAGKRKAGKVPQHSWQHHLPQA